MKTMDLDELQIPLILWETSKPKISDRVQAIELTRGLSSIQISCIP